MLLCRDLRSYSEPWFPVRSDILHLTFWQDTTVPVRLSGQLQIFNFWDILVALVPLLILMHHLKHSSANKCCHPAQLRMHQRCKRTRRRKTKKSLPNKPSHISISVIFDLSTLSKRQVSTILDETDVFCSLLRRTMWLASYCRVKRASRRTSGSQRTNSDIVFWQPRKNTRVNTMINATTWQKLTLKPLREVNAPPVVSVNYFYLQMRSICHL